MKEIVLKVSSCRHLHTRGKSNMQINFAGNHRFSLGFPWVFQPFHGFFHGFSIVFNICFHVSPPGASKIYQGRMTRHARPSLKEILHMPQIRSKILPAYRRSGKNDGGLGQLRQSVPYYSGGAWNMIFLLFHISGTLQSQMSFIYFSEGQVYHQAVFIFDGFSVKGLPFFARSDFP